MTHAKPPRTGDAQAPVLRGGSTAPGREPEGPVCAGARDGLCPPGEPGQPGERGEPGESGQPGLNAGLTGGTPAPGNGADAGVDQSGPSRDKRVRQRRITRIVGAIVAIMAVFLLAVCIAALLGLQRFQSQLSIMNNSLFPSVMTTSSVTSQLATLLLSAERMVTSETRAELRITFRNIENELANIRRSLTQIQGDSAIESNSLIQLNALEEHLVRLDGMIQERLNWSVRMRALLEEMDDVSLRLALSASAMQDPRAREAAGDTLRLLAASRQKFLSGRALNAMQLQRDAEKALAGAHAVRQSSHLAEEEALHAAALRVNDIFFAEEGLVPAARALTRLRSEIHSGLGITRRFMADLTASEVTSFNDLISLSGGIARKTADELGMFTSFFGIIALLGLIVSLCVYVFFRKSFIIRLENLNRAVQDGMHGEWRDVDSSGNDEIAIIADSVNTFARELKISTQLAETSNQAKSSFLANMSHEIRTPMNAVIGFTRMVSETDLTAIQRDYVTKIESSARFLLSIINDILDFSKIEAGKLEVEKVPFELRVIIDNVAAACEGKARAKSLRLEIFVDESLPRVLIGDPVRIFQVLNNLCDNAVKFTERGLVSLAVMQEERREDEFMVHFRVDDQGVGLTPAQMDKLFKPFSQADASTTRRFGGTGLGLTICKSLCELMGGSIGVTSEFGRGSTFFFTLPLGRTNRQDAVTHAHRDEPLPLNIAQSRILVVEDNAINQEIILALLEKTSAHVDVADNGKIAVEKALQNRYDLILMDIQMPVMDGIEATRAIRSMSPESLNAGVPIIAMTAHAMSDDIKKCLNAGMNDHVSKPIDPALLYASLRSWL